MLQPKPSLLDTFLNLQSEELLIKHISFEKLEKHLLLLSCEYIEKTLYRYNEVRPKDYTPQELIRKTRKYVNDEITLQQLRELALVIYDTSFEPATPHRAARSVIKAVEFMLEGNGIAHNFKLVVSLCRDAIMETNIKYKPNEDPVYFDEEKLKYIEWQEARFVDMLKGVHN